jgi:uncharacterized cupin superfamily protein
MSRAMDATAKVQMLGADAYAGAGESCLVAPEKLIAGNPKQTAWVQHASADGPAVNVRPGDELIIPRGFVGTWEVLQPTLKRFVIHEPDA